MLREVRSVRLQGFDQQLPEGHGRCDQLVPAHQHSVEKFLRQVVVLARPLHQVDENVCVPKDAAQSQPSRSWRTQASGSIPEKMASPDPAISKMPLSHVSFAEPAYSLRYQSSRCWYCEIGRAS